MQVATGYMVSDKVLRTSCVTLDKTKLRRKEKRNSEIFMVFFYLPFTLVALYYMNLKIYDYFLIIGFHWLLLKSCIIPSACVLGLLVYHNVLYADMILIPIFVMMNEPIKNKIKYLACAALIFFGLNMLDRCITEQFVSFSLTGRELFLVGIADSLY